MSSYPGGGGNTEAEPVTEEVVVAESAAVPEIKKVDVMNSNTQKVKNFLEDEEEEMTKRGVKIVEFENGFGGEVYVGEGNDWVEKLKESNAWKWQGHGRYDDDNELMTLIGRRNGVNGVCDKVDEDGEEIVWQDDAFNLMEIKKVPKGRGNGEARKVVNSRDSNGKIN